MPHSALRRIPKSEWEPLTQREEEFELMTQFHLCVEFMVQGGEIHLQQNWWCVYILYNERAYKQSRNATKTWHTLTLAIYTVYTDHIGSVKLRFIEAAFEVLEEGAPSLGRSCVRKPINHHRIGPDVPCISLYRPLMLRLQSVSRNVGLMCTRSTDEKLKQLPIWQRYAAQWNSSWCRSC